MEGLRLWQCQEDVGACAGSCIAWRACHSSCREIRQREMTVLLLLELRRTAAKSLAFCSKPSFNFFSRSIWFLILRITSSAGPWSASNGLTIAVKSQPLWSSFTSVCNTINSNFKSSLNASRSVELSSTIMWLMSQSLAMSTFKIQIRWLNLRGIFKSRDAKQAKPGAGILKEMCPQCLLMQRLWLGVERPQIAAMLAGKAAASSRFVAPFWLSVMWQTVMW